MIVGAGPVGLTLALDLAWRGIDVVVERRCDGEPPRIRSNHVSARSMEIFRRLGAAKAMREAGLPADYPNDIAFRTTPADIARPGPVGDAVRARLDPRPRQLRDQQRERWLFLRRAV